MVTAACESCRPTRFCERKIPLAFARSIHHTHCHPFPTVSTPATSDSPPVADQARWFADEVQPHDSSLRAYLRGAFPGVRDVEDVVQDSYLRVWKRHTERPIASAKAFLFKVARHLALNTLRHERASPFLDVTDSSTSRVIETGPGVAEHVCIREETMILFAAIDALPGRCREVYILRKLKGLSQKQIAAALGISEQTVEVQVVRANHRCEAFLRKHGVIRS
jgi:RNA polymerase sigma factor (sigma-70 family)